MLLPPEKMTIGQLESRRNYHESNADTFEQHKEFSMADEFRALARKYQDELDKRKATR